MIIYKATNLINNKTYIGATVQTLEGRKNSHLRNAYKYNINRYFYNAMRKYGQENFNWEIIDKDTDYNELMKKEKYWIKQSNSFGVNGYNLCEGGNNTIGYQFSEESKQKMSEKAKLRKYPKGKDSPFYGKKMSVESKNKISNKLKGKNNPMFNRSFFDIWVEKYGIEEANKKLRIFKEKQLNREFNPMLGKKHSKESKEKISAKAKQRTGNKNSFYGKTHSMEQKKNGLNKEKVEN